MLFSQRKGLKPAKSTMQIDSMDSDLRVGLGNALMLYYWEGVNDDQLSEYHAHEREVWTLCRRIWMHYFKKPFQSLERYWPKIFRELSDYFQKCEWYEVYDFIEFVANQSF